MKYRDLVLGGGALPAMIQTAEDCDEQSKVAILAYALSRLCGGVPAPDQLVIEKTLPLLAALLSSC